MILDDLDRLGSLLGLVLSVLGSVAAVLVYRVERRDRAAERLTGADPRQRPGMTGGHGQAPSGPDAATRHLSAGAYLDERFRRVALQKVYYDATRFVAPSYGFDLTVVLAHCLRARNMAAVRDAAILVGVASAACALPPRTVVGTAVLLLQFQILVTLGRLVVDAWSALRASPPQPGRATVRRIVVRLLGVLLGALVVWLSPAVEADASTPWSAEWTGADLWPSGSEVLVSALLIAGCAAAGVTWRRRLTRLVTDAPAAIPEELSSGRTADIDIQSRSSAVVFSGTSPFIGSGPVRSSWSAAVRLVGEPEQAAAGSPAARKQYSVFSEADLLHRITAGLAPDSAGERHPSLAVDSRVFLNGTAVPGPPRRISGDEVAALLATGAGFARRYLVCQIVSWGGELVVTAHLNVQIRGDLLYLECTTTVLPPSDERFHVVDRSSGGAEAARAALRAAIDAPSTLVRAPANLLRSLADVSIGARRPRPDRRDCGARFSLREFATGTEPIPSFAMLDVLRNAALIERRVLAIVFESLAGYGVDTQEFAQHSTAILNNSVLRSFDVGVVRSTGQPVPGSAVPPSSSGAPWVQ